MDFGPHRFYEKHRILYRYDDAVLYAMAQYVYSLKPPLNPNRFDAKAAHGQKVFTREGCMGCHTPPLYTNNKLTLAQGYTPPKDHPLREDILPVSVGTDPGLALKTRKGTGLYKVPSLRGVWYRGHYLHDGSVASLEEMFDEHRFRPDHAPGGWKGPGVVRRAIPGHPFGMKLPADDKAGLIAFLRTL
jgi:cytochrome c peroxidase